MPINNITQTISELPAAGRRGVDVRTQFVIKQEDFQDHLQGTTVTELNTLKDQLNTRIGEINSTTTTMNGYATSASSSASTATTKAGEASTSASQALTYRNQASTSAAEAATSAASLTPSGILTAIKTVDGTGSGLDADLLDGKHSTDFALSQDASSVSDLNTLLVSGCYRINTPSNKPEGVHYGNILVMHGGGSDTLTQLVTGYESTNIYWRSGNGYGATWQPWRRILSDGNALTTAPLGYASGSGGTVTQDTDKNTAITLNKLCGTINTSNSALTAGQSVIFVLNNTYITQIDTCIITPYYGYVPFNNYRIEVVGNGSGNVRIRITNISSGTLSDILIFNFIVLKGAIS